jgi:hypothetical protein
MTTSVTLNWIPFAVGSGTNTAQSYLVQAATDTTFGTISGSSSTTDVTLSTLTVSGLTTNTAYYFRVGGTNWNNVANFVLVGPVTTGAGPAPTNPLITAVYVSSLTVTWGSVTSFSGYSLEASTGAWPNTFTGNVSSVTTNGSATTLTFNLGTLNPDTTYFIRVGSLWNGATTYSATQPSTSTLTNLINPSVLSVTSNTVTAGWPAFAVGSGTNTTQGYRLEAYSDAGYTSLIASSQTAVATLSTLTVSGLTPFTTYYLKAGAINWNSVVNYVTFGSTRTDAGPAPSPVTIGAVYITSITVNFGTVGGSGGYELDASSTNFVGGVTLSSITSVNTLGSLTVLGLNPDTTYFLKVGSLWNGATSYALSVPSSTSTLTNLINPSLLSVTSNTVTAGWPAFSVGSGTNTTQGYRFEAYSDPGYATLIASSQTTVATLSTLTISGLTPYTTYYLRAGATNWNSVVNYVTFGSTRTDAGPAPSPVTIGAVYITSITVNYGTVSGSGGYELDASSTNFVGGVVLSSISTNGALGSLTVLGLNPDTTYFLKVGSLWNGATTYSLTQPSTSTLTNLLLNAQIYQVFTTSATANWTPFSAGSGTNTAQGYELDASTASDFSGQIFSSTTFNASLSTLTVNGLSTSVLYYFRAGAINWNNVVNFSSLGSASTGAGPAPTNPIIVNVAVSSIAVTWGSVSAISGYELDASTASNFTGTLVSSITTNGNLTGLTVIGLFPNTTYYLRAGSLWNGATTYANTTPISTSTLANQVSGQTFGTISYQSISITWQPLPPAPSSSTAEGYLVLASTASDFTGTLFSSKTYVVSDSTLTVSGLTPATTYFFEVGSLNYNNVPDFVFVGSTATLLPPAPTGLAGTAQGVSSMTWAWGAVTGATAYKLYMATSPTTVVYTGAANTFTEINLSTNTAYGRQVSAIVSGVESPLSPSVTDYTMAAVPGQPAFSNVFYTSFTVTWATNGNPPPNTPYEVSTSTDPTFATGVSTPIALTDGFLNNTTTFVNLSPATTYYVRVRAENGDVKFVTGFSLTGSTVTLGVPAPAGLSGTAQGVSSITWNWGAVSGASSYNLRVASAPATIIASGMATNTFTETGLSTNTAYGRVVTAIIGGIESGLSNSATTYTSAAVPTNASISGVTNTQLTLSWLANQNPSGTRFEVSESTDNFVANFSTPVAISANFTATTTTFINLSAATTYYLRIRAANGDGFLSDFLGPVSTETQTAAPTGLIGTAQGVSSITWTWNAVQGAASYKIRSASSTATLIATVASPTTSYTEIGLSTNTAYGRVVSAVNGAGLESGLSLAATTYTLAASPTGSSFVGVFTTSITVQWNTSDPAGTAYQAILSTDPAFGILTTSSTLNTNAAFTGLVGGTTYYVHVRAQNGDGFNTAFDVTLTTTTLAPLQPPTNVAFTMVAISSVTVSWSPVAGSNIQYVVQLASSGFFATTYSSTTVGTSATFTGLSTNTLYGAQVQTQNTVTGSSSAFSGLVSTYTLAAPPILLSTTAVTATSVSLSWNGNGDPNTTQFGVERSTDGVTYAALATQLGTTFQDVTVIGGFTYSYRVRAFNANNIPTTYSNVVTVTIAGSPVNPKVPSGFWAEGAGVVTYHWRVVSQRTDGSTLTNLAGYEIYQSNNVLTPLNQWVLVTTVTTNSWTTTATPGSPSYYCVRAIDAAGLQSAYTHVIDDTNGLVHYFIYTDGLTRAQLPQVAANVLLQQNNTFGSDLTLQWTKVPAEEIGTVVRSMTLQAIADTSGNAVPLNFNPPSLQGILAYTVVNGQVVQGAEPIFSSYLGARGPAMNLATSGAPVVPAAQAATSLSLFWYNGNEWTKGTGQVNTQNNTMTFTGSQIGRFQIRFASHAPTTSQISLTRVYPRIITPNGDGWNDKAIFQFDNPQLLPLSGKIYDISGALVANLKAGPNPNSTLEWDGKDSAGTVVPGGLYIYQIDESGTSETGTVVVAR